MRHSALIAVGFAVIILSGCGSAHESMARNAIAILKDSADELSAIKDATTAESATPRLKELGSRWRANERRLAETRGPSSRDMKELDKKYGGQLAEAMKRYLLEVARVQRIDGGPEALTALGELKGRPSYGMK